MKNVIKMIDEKTAQVTKAFQKKACIYGTEEFKLWREYKAEFPEAVMVTKDIKKNPLKKTSSKNMTYKNMANYYAISYDSKWKKFIPYRIDRMKNVKELQEPQDGYEEFRSIDMKSYTQRVFGMFGGEKKRVSIRFTNDMIDTVVDRFGSGSDSSSIFYIPDGNTHFILNADIEISDQFFSWICGFRKKAVITKPQEVIEDFQKFLDDIANRYNENQPET